MKKTWYVVEVGGGHFEEVKTTLTLRKTCFALEKYGRLEEVVINGGFTALIQYLLNNPKALSVMMKISYP